MKKYFFCIFLCICSLIQAKVSDQMQESKNEGRQVYVLFYKVENDKSNAIKSMVEKFVAKNENLAFYSCNITTDECSDLIKTYDLKRTPMPFLLSIAPNGAITGGFPLDVTEEKLEKSLVSPGMQIVMKAMQDKKVLILSLNSNASQEGVKELLNDARFSQGIVHLNDPSLASPFGVNLSSNDIITLLIAPPGTVIKQFTGNTTKEQFIEALTSASSPCCPGGCCPGGCCPGGKCK